jgi:hypothetical protein
MAISNKYTSVCLHVMITSRRSRVVVLFRPLSLRRRAGAGADQIRAGNQSQERKSAQPSHTAPLLATADEVIE